MCGLCGIVDADGHWTAGPRPARDAAPATASHARALERRRLAALATVALHDLRVTVEDFGGGAFVVRAATGAAEIVASLPEVWRAAGRLTGRLTDPLSAPPGAP